MELSFITAVTVQHPLYTIMNQQQLHGLQELQIFPL